MAEGDSGMPAVWEIGRGSSAPLTPLERELVEALRPLAKCEIIECDTPLLDSDSARYFMRMGEIRAARAALAKAEAKEKGNR